ncbi:multidrug effflux MFS transporter [Exilibacterium tricleocarpae]|uniref:Multidrug effflux MFS transporter n=1 Tax=Exilibacterium tricleocarpae TaxID=2591008 RepID=A0A545U9C9_9GAMM|nr:multidrug effflux MFS transporter [Exilibacterium tricleocarpae]TQV86071.1 multidrug effflux MFS transporter [Exilibacterium tricleocarpae]
MKTRPDHSEARCLTETSDGLEAAGSSHSNTVAACSKVRDSWSFLLVLVLVTALGPLAMTSFIPAIPAIQRGFDVPPAVAQLTLSVSIWAMAVCSLFYGTLADSIGRRFVLLWGVAIAVIGSGLCALAPSIEWVIAGRALQAAGATSGFVLARVIVRDVYGDGRAASVLGYITAAMTLAPMFGPLLGGFLIETTGWRSVFASVGGIAALLWLLLAVQLPETRPASLPPTSAALDFPVFRQLLALNRYRRYLLFGTMSQCTFMAFLAGAPYIITHHFGLPATAYGFYFIGIPIGFALGSFMAGRYGDRIGRERLLTLGAAVSLLACSVAAAISHSTLFTPWGLFLPAAAVAVAQGAALPGAQIGVLAAAGQRSGAASGLFSFSQLAVSGLVAQLVGLLIGFGPITVTAVMTATSALAWASLFIRTGATRT